MKVKICFLALVLIISTLTIPISFGNSIIKEKPELSLEVIKEVWDGQNWVDEIDAEPGDTLSFRVSVTYYNVTDPDRPHTAVNIYINDTLPDCFEYVPGSSDPQEPTINGNLLTWDFSDTIPILFHEQSIVLKFNASIAEDGCLGEQINEAESDADEICTGNHLWHEDTAIVNVLLPDPEIDVEKYVFDGCEWAEETYAYNGTDVTFKIVVENIGVVNLFNVYVNDTLPDGLQYNNSATVNGLPQEPSFDGDVFYWYFDIVEIGEIIEIEFNAYVDGQPCSSNENWVVAIGENQCGQTDEDEDSATVIIYGMCVNKEVWDKESSEWVEEIETFIGEIIWFRITVYYIGELILKDISVKDQLPDCLNYAGDASPEEPEVSGDGKTLWWNLSDDYNLEYGESVEIEFSAEVIENTCQPCANWAYVTAMECGIREMYGEDSATITVICDLVADAGGPYSGNINQQIQITGSATGGKAPYEYFWDLDEDGQYDDDTGSTITHTWDEGGTYNIWLKVIDDHDNYDTDYATVIITEDNNPPNKPSITGPSTGTPDEEYDFIVAASDNDGDQVFLYIDWGDGTTVEWDGPYSSGQDVNYNHAWTTAETYTIRLKARDIYNAESGWREMDIIIPRYKMKFDNSLCSIMSRIAELLPILKLILHRFQ